jgi:hypothetical protein
MHIFSHAKTGSSFRLHDTFKHRLMENPYLHWMLILCATVLLSVVLMGIGFMKYTNAKARMSESSTPVTTAASHLFSVEELSATLKNFDTRAEQRAVFVKGYTGVGDPMQ